MELFLELNFSDALIKEIRETRKLKKREMKTPQKNDYLRDLSKSPSYRKKRANVMDAQTQTDYIIPVETRSKYDCIIPQSQSLL